MSDPDFKPRPRVKQLNFPRLMAARTKKGIPDDLRSDRFGLSAWIDQHKAEFDEIQAAYSQRIAHPCLYWLCARL